MKSPSSTGWLSLLAGLALVAGPIACGDDGPRVGGREGGAANDSNGNGDNSPSESEDIQDAGGSVDTSSSLEDASSPGNTSDSSSSDPEDSSGNNDKDAGNSSKRPCWPDVGNTSNPSCSEPSPCPSPDNAEDPKLTCHRPNWVPGLENTTLHIYGRHLVNENGPPAAVIYRDVETTGTIGKRQDEIEVVSNCHIKAELELKFTNLQCGDRIEFRLQRKTQDDASRDVGRKGIVSGWRRLFVTK